MLTDEDVKAIQRWASGHDDRVRAAVGLLVEHDRWLRDEGFAERCVSRYPDGTVCVDFDAVAAYWRDGSPCSASEAAILLAIADIGSGRWRVSTMDHRNRRRLLRALAVAVTGSSSVLKLAVTGSSSVLKLGED